MCIYNYEAPKAPASNTENCRAVGVSVRVANLDPATGVPTGTITYGDNDSVDQQTHKDTVDSRVGGNYKWERLFQSRRVPATAGQMLIFGLQLNDDWSIHPGNRIVDAVRFIRRTGGIDVIIDESQPAQYTDVINNPGAIFSTAGFRTSDDVYRGFEDMGSEPGGGGFSKTHFFLMNACSINDFTYTRSQFGILDKNIGNLYALGYNGLICMGASTPDYYGNNKSTYTQSLRMGDCFGQAYLNKINTDFHYPRFVLLGAGTLRAQPYIQYGSERIENEDITYIRGVSTNNPVLIRGVTVSGNGNLYVTSTYAAGASPFGTHGEIVIRPETALSPTGINEVRLNAY